MTISEQPQSMLDYALGYARAELRVFPLHSVRNGACSCGRAQCSSMGKHPRTKNGVKDATSDPEQICQWWTSYPEANIGIATGNGLYVIDLDTAKGASVTGTEDDKNDFSALLEQSLSVQTGSGGYHIYLRYDPALLLSNTASKLGPFIDTRGEGGYVVAPPSFNKDGQYTWINRCEMQQIPANLLSVLRLVSAVHSKEQQHDQLSHPAQTGAAQKTAATPARTEAADSTGTAAQTRVASEGRNNFLMKLGGYYRSLSANVDEIRLALLHDNEMFFGNGRHPQGPLSLEEMESTIFKTVAKLEAENGVVEQRERRVHFQDDDEFENRPPREWLIADILPKEGVALVFGPSGSCKSFLTMDWSCCIGTGTPWQGREVIQGQVAYIAGEGGFGIGGRIRAWKTYHSYEGKSGVKWFPEAVALQDSGTFNELVAAFLDDFETPPVLVVLDTLSRCSGGAEENSNTDMAAIIAAADTLQQRFHCTILIVHHAGKDSERGPRGASALTANTETVIAVAATDTGCRVSCSKQKDGAKFESFSLKLQSVEYDPVNHQSSAVLVPDSENSQPALRQSESAMLAALREAEGPLTYGEWVKAGMDADLKESTAKQAIMTLSQSSHVVKKGKRYLLQREEGNEEAGQLPLDDVAD